MSFDSEQWKNKGRGFVPEPAPDVLGHGRAPYLGAAFSDSSRLPVTPVLDQGAASTCAANAFADALLVRSLVQGMPSAHLFSRLWLYWYARADVTVDAGAAFSNVVSTLSACGVPAETHWPYDAAKVFDPPPLAAAQHAFDQRGGCKMHPLDGSRETFASLSVGRPVVVGFRSIFGGPHAVLIVGHEVSTHEILIKNSWGEDFGQHGHAWLDASLLDGDECIGLWSIDWAVSPSEDAK